MEGLMKPTRYLEFRVVFRVVESAGLLGLQGNDRKSLPWSYLPSGGEGTRTPDLYIANVPLSQLSYTPESRGFTLVSADAGQEESL